MAVADDGQKTMKEASRVLATDAATEPAGQQRPPAHPLLRRADASRYLVEVWGIRRAPATLAKLAVVGGGPRFYKAGKWPMYDSADLDAWARELLGQPLRNTSDRRGGA